jgi:hypothetical protein
MPAFAAGAAEIGKRSVCPRFFVYRFACGVVLPSVIPSAQRMASKYIFEMSGSSQLSLVCPRVE